MLRSVVSVVRSSGKKLLFNNAKTTAVDLTQTMKHHTETDEEFDARFEAYFNRPEIDGWEVRKGINDLIADDLVPEPKLIIAGLKACRRVNDYSLGVRFLEAVKFKCGNKANEIYPWIIQEVTPTLEELGLDTPEALGYDKPELALVDVDDIH